mgnify:FL=1
MRTGMMMWARYVLVMALWLLAGTHGAQADETEHRLGQGVTVAAGIGVDVTHGDYGDGADATSVTMPVTVAVNPSETVDVTLQIPLVYQTSRVGSSFVVYPSGGAGRRRNATNVAQGATTVTSTATVSETGLGDINLSAGWAVVQEGDLVPRVRATAYLKLPSGDKDRGLGTGTFEGGPGLSVSKWFGAVQLFADGSYILQDRTDWYQGKDYFSYSGGGGLQATDRLFVSLYAKGSTVRVEGADTPVEGRLKVNFLQSRRVSWEAYALAGFTDASPAVGGGLLVLYQF